MKIAAKEVLSQGPLLDVGCGSGLISKLVPAGLPYVGVDFNSNYLSIDWKGRTVDGRVLANILQLPAKSTSFGTVFLLHVVEHFPESLQSRLLKEVNRVLKPGGKLVMSTPNRKTWSHAELFLPPKNPKHFHCLDTREVEVLLRQAEFGAIRRHGYDIFLDYPNSLARLIPYSIRRRLASGFSKLEKWLIFTALKRHEGELPS